MGEEPLGVGGLASAQHEAVARFDAEEQLGVVERDIFGGESPALAQQVGGQMGGRGRLGVEEEAAEFARGVVAQQQRRARRAGGSDAVFGDDVGVVKVGHEGGRNEGQVGLPFGKEFGAALRCSRQQLADAEVRSVPDAIDEGERVGIRRYGDMGYCDHHPWVVSNWFNTQR